MAARGQVLVLDLLRFTAAMAVVLYHLAASAALHPTAPLHLFAPAPAMPAGGVPWTWAGWVGVELFFVISGYVIARSGHGASPRAFLRRRALRLAPAAWLCASATALVLLAGSRLGASEIAGRWSAALLFLPTTAPIDGSYWTLEVEWVFYLLAALALRGGEASAIERLGVRLGLASAGFWLLATALRVPGATLEDNVFLALTLMPHGAFFALGVVLNAVHERGWAGRRAALALLFASAGAAEIVAHAGRFAGLAPGIGAPAAPLTLFAAGALAIGAAPLLQRPLALLGPARLATLGLATYPLYLLHQVIGAALMAAALRAGLPAPLAVLGTIMLMLAAALLVSTQLEPRLRAWLARLGTIRRPNLGRPPVLPAS